VLSVTTSTIRERSTHFIKRVLDCAVVTRIQELDHQEESEEVEKLEDVD
jgi:hypothetical protein